LALLLLPIKKVCAMNLKNYLRTLLKIRVTRELSPPGAMPPVGSNIVRDRIRIRLKYPVSNEQWEWFSKQGWRTVDMRTNRRRYTCVPDNVLVRLLNTKEPERSVLHQRLIKALGESSREDRTTATVVETEESSS
jgi:hypothetical protein